MYVHSQDRSQVRVLLLVMQIEICTATDMRTFLLATCVVGLAASCSGGSDKKIVPVDAAIDSPPVKMDSAPTCPISKMDFGDLGTVAMGTAAIWDPDTAGTPPTPNATGVIRLAASASGADILGITLKQGVAPNGAQLAPGTFQLTGDQLDPNKCGACLFLAGQAKSAQDVGGFFAPTGGTLKVTEVGNAAGQKLTLELTNATFVLMSNAGPVTSCTTKIGKVGLSATMTMAMNRVGLAESRYAALLAQPSLLAQ